MEGYSGFLTVNKSTSSHLFFILQLAETASSSTPLVLWLQGGPGSPSTYGAFKEVGTHYVLKTKGKKAKLILNRERWTKHAHMLFIDNPVGVGYSFTEDEEGYTEDDEHIAEHLEEALHQVEGESCCRPPLIVCFIVQYILVRIFPLPIDLLQQ